MGNANYLPSICIVFYGSNVSAPPQSITNEHVCEYGEYGVLVYAETKKVNNVSTLEQDRVCTSGHLCFPFLQRP